MTAGGVRIIRVLRRNIVLVAITAACFAFYLAYSLSNYAEYRRSTWDLGIFDQAIRAYAHFRDPIAPLKSPDYSLLGDHFHPILAVLGPVYWVWNNPTALLMAQALLLAWSLPAVHRFAQRRLGSRAALVVTAAYGIGWPLQSMVDFEFHEVAFAVPLLALAIEALDRRDVPRLLVWSVLLLLVKEDMGIVVAMLGLVLWSHGLRDRVSSQVDVRARLRAVIPPLPAAILLIGGLVAYVLLTSVIIPALSPSGSYAYWTYSGLGKNLPDALGSIVTDPLHAARLFVTPHVKLQTLLALVLPALPALASRYVLIVLPLLAELFFSTNPALWGHAFHYDAVPWVVLALAGIDGIVNIRALLPERRHRVIERLMVGLTATATSVLALLAMVDAHLSSHVTNWRGDDHAQAWRSAQATIPTNACVLASNVVAGHLTYRDYVRQPDLPFTYPDFLIVDPTLPSIGGHASAADVVAAARSAGYATIFNRKSVVVLKSPMYQGPTSRCGPLGKGPVVTQSR